MRNIYIIALLSLLINCSQKKNENNKLNTKQEQLEIQTKLLKILENKYGFVDALESDGNFTYEKNKNGFVNYIRIHDEGINILPTEIYSFPHLIGLNLFNCEFTDIPVNIQNFKSLESVILGKNPIKVIKNIKIPNSLKSITLNKTLIQELPHLKKENDSIAYELFLTDTFIDSIPDFVGDMNLKALWLERCPITYISPNLGNCENMEELQFEANPFLKEFPASLAKLKKMRKIHFNWLPIKKIPDFVFEWENLKTIKVNRCFIEEIPAEIGKLKNLTHLYAKGNKIKTLPKEMGELKEMHLIHLDGNPIDTKSLPAELFFPREDDYKALLITSATGCYTCFSVPEEQVRKAFDLD